MVAGKLAARGVTLEDLEAGPIDNPLAPAVLFEGRRFPTKSGRVNLIHEAPPPALPRPADFPLLLTSVSNLRSQSSQWYRAARGAADAHRASRRRGGPVRRRRLLARIGARPPGGAAASRRAPAPRRCALPKGGHLHRGTAANALTRARVTDLGEGGALYEEPVRLVKR